jgi:hypothetical protein
MKKGKFIIEYKEIKPKVYYMDNGRNNPSFKTCRHLISTNKLSLVYCLKYHEWLSQCPQKCAYYQKGDPGNLNDLETKRYNIECLYFTNIDTENGDYMCQLFKQNNPLCEPCQFAKMND